MQKVPDGLWNAFLEQVGDPGHHVRLVAALPKTVIVQGAAQASTAAGNGFSAIQAVWRIQAAHLGLVWRTARKLVHMWSGLLGAEFRDIDPWEFVAPGDQQTQGSNGGHEPSRWQP